MRRMSCVVMSLLCAVLPGWWGLARAGQSPAGINDFRGRTVTLLANFGVGGATDIFARALAPYLQKHIPGNPTVIVQNMPGAGGVTGATWLYQAARKDGTYIGVFSSPFADQILGNVQYDTRGFYWLGGVAEASVSYFHRSLGITSSRDLLRSRVRIVMGGFSPGSGKDLSQRTFFEAVGADYRYVTGYSSNADLLAATLRGEINFSQVSLTSWATSFPEHVQDGTVIPASQTGILGEDGNVIRDPRVGEIPTALELAEALIGLDVRSTTPYRANVAIVGMQSAMLRAIVLPPGSPPAVGEVLRQAVARVFQDPEFKMQSRQQQGFEFVFIDGARAQAVATRIVESADSSVVGYLMRLQEERR